MSRRSVFSYAKLQYVLFINLLKYSPFICNWTSLQMKTIMHYLLFSTFVGYFLLTLQNRCRETWYGITPSCINSGIKCLLMIRDGARLSIDGKPSHHSRGNLPLPSWLLFSIPYLYVGFQVPIENPQIMIIFAHKMLRFHIYTHVDMIAPEITAL